jgi:hypothetical protein
VADRFAIATLEELWWRGRRLERRLSHGEAIQDADGVVASDAYDALLAGRCDAAIAAMQRFVVDDARTRLVAEAEHGGALTLTITVSIGSRSIVTDPSHFAGDVALLREASQPVVPHAGPERLPMLWRHGSGAVLLHEAFGHPLEHGRDAAPWPGWLTVDVPLAPRRASFRDVPLVRMTTLRARQRGAPLTLPERRVEVLLVDGGSYEPLTDRVTLRIGAADLVEDGQTRRIAPFVISGQRDVVARSLYGAAGDPVRYPGVICSREGQELVVGSFAPLLLTEPW